ncbi:hypothetical protein CMO96_00895 [Candidatus Woesebacteria bacterium]|nr:hypothetical protein [Candidatus Woesebacteria bacterium]
MPGIFVESRVAGQPQSVPLDTDLFPFRNGLRKNLLSNGKGILQPTSEGFYIAGCPGIVIVRSLNTKSSMPSQPFLLQNNDRVIVPNPENPNVLSLERSTDLNPPSGDNQMSYISSVEFTVPTAWMREETRPRCTFTIGESKIFSSRFDLDRIESQDIQDTPVLPTWQKCKLSWWRETENHEGPTLRLLMPNMNQDPYILRGLKLHLERRRP